MGLPELEVVLGWATSSDLLLFIAICSFLETATGATGAPGATEVVARSAARTPLPHAPKVRMTVVNKLPQMILLIQIAWKAFPPTSGPTMPYGCASKKS